MRLRHPIRHLLGLILLASASRAAPVDYGREVRPILSDKCYHCHGPDESSRKAKLRFDTREGALRIRNDVAAIVPGKSAESELLHRVRSTDTEEMMPPPEAKLGRLTDAEIATLKRWIDEGAPFQSHWSFEPLTRVAVPAPSRPAAGTSGVVARNAIDHFVFAGLAARQLAPQSAADRATLIRRVTFDLTGLPPTPEEVRAFVTDPDAQAYERLVDRLLQSPRYGERMAVDWLDVSRYADSYGFQVDRERDMWPWRDWVIKAFNENLPWDKFVTWQLAGDLLPNATDEQVLATAFNRLHAQESEGGSVEEEYRVNYVNDRVTTFGTAFLGLTLECARCHDHKFDPISQKEFYQLFAFFDDIDEAGLYSFFTRSAPTPAMWLSSVEQKAQFAAATAAVTAEEQKLAKLRDTRRAAFAEWTAKRMSDASPLVVRDELARFTFDERGSTNRAADAKVVAAAAAAAGEPAEPPPPSAAERPGALGKFASTIDEEQLATTTKENESVPGRSGLAVKLTGDHAIKTSLGNFKRHEPFTIALWLRTPDVKERAVILHRSRAWTDAGSRGYELLIEEGKLKWSLIHFWPGDAISIRTTAPVPVDAWVHVAVTNDGSGRAAGLRVFVNGQLSTTDVIRDNLTKDITGGGGDTIAVGERFRDRGFKDGLVDDLRIFNRALTDAETRSLHSEEEVVVSSAAPGVVFDYYLAAHDEPYRAQMAALTAARAARTKLADEMKEIMVMRELPQPKMAHVLKRGDYDQRGEVVQPNTPAALPAFPQNQPRNRLGLARWLTEPRHPLLARVTVNRFWQGLFGRGLVKTVDDFGSQGERAEYPALLDWLAGELVRLNWDVKALLRTIVLSHTYQQRSFATPELMTDDPENIWLARGARYRLPAEMIRDHALAASGLLVEKLGGPPVFTYDIPESFKPAPAGKGEQLYRRSVYTFWRRNGPAPMLEAFDVPKRVVCVARRDTTNTPLHAFVLLNGPQFVEAARVLAEKLQRESAGRRDELVEMVFARMIGRPADANERAILGRMLDEQLAWYRARPEEAERYLKIGDTPCDATLPAPEVAALATTINTLMSHDAFVVKR